MKCPHFGGSCDFAGIGIGCTNPWSCPNAPEDEGIEYEEEQEEE